MSPQPIRASGTLGWDDRAAKAIVKRGSEGRASAYLDVIEDYFRINGPLFLGDRLSAVGFYLVMLAR